MAYSDRSVPSQYVDVHTDGACSNNGRSNAKGGIGVFWGENHSSNVSEPLVGRQTNNRAEIMAATRALQDAKSMGHTHVTLHSDSQFLIKGTTEWKENWKENGWKLADNSDVKNKEDFLELDRAEQGLEDVRYEYVPAHSGDPGNEAADRLSRAGIPK